MAEATEIEKDPSEGEFLPAKDAQARIAQLLKEQNDPVRDAERKAILESRDPSSGDFLKRAEGTLTEYEKSVRDAMAARRKAAEQTEPAYQEALKRMQAVEAQPLPTMPTRPTLPTVPTRAASIDQTAAKSLFTVASVIGALGMMGGRGRGMLAMRGLTGAVQGFRENNYEKYKASMDEYHAQVKQQLDLYQMARDDYIDQLNARGRNLDEIFRELSLKAQIYNYPAMQKAADAKDLNGVIKAEAELGKMQAELEKASQADMLAPIKKQIADISLQKAGIELNRARVELQKLQTGGGKTDTNARTAANELAGKLQAQLKQLDKDIPASRQYFGLKDTPETQTLINEKARVQGELNQVLNQLKTISGVGPTPSAPRKPEAGTPAAGKTPPGYMRIRNKQTGQVVDYPTGETPRGWSRIQ